MINIFFILIFVIILSNFTFAQSNITYCELNDKGECTENNIVKIDLLNNESYKDITELNYKREGNTLVIDNDRRLDFGISYNGQTYFSDSVEIDLKEYYYFYDNRPLKIEHRIKNKLTKSIKGAHFFYRFTYDLMDDIKPKPKHNMVVFNEDYLFDYQDLIDTNFTFVTYSFDADYFYLEFSMPNDIEALQEIILDPTINSGEILSMEATPLDEDTFALLYSEVTTDDLNLTIYNLDGTTVCNVKVDESTGDQDQDMVSISAFNSTTLCVGFWEDGGSDVMYGVYDSNCNELVTPFDIDTDTDFSASVSVSASNSTVCAILYMDNNDNNVNWRIFDSQGNSLLAITNIDNVVDQTASGTIKAVNRTDYVTAYEPATDELSSTIELLGGATKVDRVQIVTTNLDLIKGRFVALMNDTTQIYTYVLSDEVFIETYDNTLTEVVGQTSVQASTFGSSRSLVITRLNSTSAVISWLDDTNTDDPVYAIVNSDGTIRNASVAVASTSGVASDDIATVASSELATNISFCDNVFVYAYDVGGTNEWLAILAQNGSAFDGTCSTPPPEGDTCDTCNIDCTESCTVDTELDCSDNGLNITGGAGHIRVTADIINCGANVLIQGTPGNICEVTTTNAQFC